jgi:hypothetical protein
MQLFQHPLRLRSNWYIAVYVAMFLAMILLLPATLTKLPFLLGLSAGYAEIKLSSMTSMFLLPPVRIISSLLYGNSFNLQTTWLSLRVDSYTYLPIQHSGKTLILTYAVYWVGLSIAIYQLLVILFKRRAKMLAFLSMLFSHLILFTAGLMVLVLYTT